MITETGKVIALKGDQAWVQTIRASACQCCAARHGCGQKALATVTGGRANQVLVANTVDARVGDEVVIGIPEQALLGASLLVYALPLLTLVLGSVVGHQLAPSGDLPAMIGGAGGLASGLGLAALWQRRLGSACEPRLVRVQRAASAACQ